MTSVFSFFPTGALDSYTAVNGTSISSSASINQTASEFSTTSETLGFAGSLINLLTFNITGLPSWAVLFFVYLPLVLLVASIYGLIRGI